MLVKKQTNKQNKNKQTNKKNRKRKKLDKLSPKNSKKKCAGEFLKTFLCRIAT